MQHTTSTLGLVSHHLLDARPKSWKFQPITRACTAETLLRVYYVSRSLNLLIDSSHTPAKKSLALGTL